MIQHTFSPTVLIVDDDPAVLDIARQEFYQHTSLGVVVMDNLCDARKLIDEKRVHFNAVMADLSIMPDKRDPMHNLHDGIDFLAYIAEKETNDIPKYVLSVYNDVPSYRDRSKSRNLVIEAWFPKLVFGTGDSDAEAPWHQIERELFRRRLEENPALSELLDDEDRSPKSFSDAVRKKIRPIVRTYLQELSDPYKVILPIEVVCRNEDDTWMADALQLGLLQAGVGETMEEALENLGDLIAEQYQTFQEADPGEIEGYAAKVFETFKEYVAPIVQ